MFLRGRRSLDQSLIGSACGSGYKEMLPQHCFRRLTFTLLELLRVFVHLLIWTLLQCRLLRRFLCTLLVFLLNWFLNWFSQSVSLTVCIQRLLFEFPQKRFSLLFIFQESSRLTDRQSLGCWCTAGHLSDLASSGTHYTGLRPLAKFRTHLQACKFRLNHIWIQVRLLKLVLLRVKLNSFLLLIVLRSLGQTSCTLLLFH